MDGVTPPKPKAKATSPHRSLPLSLKVRHEELAVRLREMGARNSLTLAPMLVTFTKLDNRNDKNADGTHILRRPLATAAAAAERSPAMP